MHVEHDGKIPGRASILIGVAYVYVWSSEYCTRIILLLWIAKRSRRIDCRGLRSSGKRINLVLCVFPSLAEWRDRQTRPLVHLASQFRPFFFSDGHKTKIPNTGGFFRSEITSFGTCCPTDILTRCRLTCPLLCLGAFGLQRENRDYVNHATYACPTLP